MSAVPYELAAVQAAYAWGRVTTRGLADFIGRSTKSASAILRGLGSKGILA